jgi:BASS family bile acid:Na+ symporter
MDLTHPVMLALQASIVGTVFSFGLKATPADLTYLLRRPGLLVRSILAVFVIMPLVAVALIALFSFQPAVKVLLVALAISPVPPLLPKRETMARGHASYGLALMAVLGVLAIVLVPAALALIAWIDGRALGLSPARVAAPIVTAILLPLTAGMAFRAMRPAASDRIARGVALAATTLLVGSVLVLVAGSFTHIWALVGRGTVLAFVLFTIAGLVVGHVLGGPNPDHSTVLALSTACRHPAIALAIASANFPDRPFGGLILLYLIVSVVAGIPYIKWQRQRHDRQLARAA